MNLSKRILAKLPEYRQAMEEKYQINNIDDDVLEGIAFWLWRSNFDRDANKVACQQEHELRYIRKVFLIGRLGITDLSNEEMDQAIEEVCEEMGRSNRNKQRAIFYYLLTFKLKKQDEFQPIEPVDADPA